MAENLNYLLPDLSQKSPIDLLKIRKDLVAMIFEIGTPLNGEETLLFEALSAQCDVVDYLLQ
jgi:hypothetical protein